MWNEGQKHLFKKFGKQKEEIEEQAKRHESEIENTETLLKRSTSAQVMQPNELMDKILKEENTKKTVTVMTVFYKNFFL